MSTTERARVLVIDDELEMRRMLVEGLTDETLEVSAVANDAEAVDVAAHFCPDMLVVDSPDSSKGVDVVGKLRKVLGEIPLVIITSGGDYETVIEATRKRPIEVIAKPVDIKHLRNTLHEEMARIQELRHKTRRNRRLRTLARDVNRERKVMHEQLENTCADLASAYRDLSAQIAIQQIALAYQNELLMAESDDDVFRTLFGVFAQHSGPICGMALVCNTEAQLRMAGRFGVPKPDGSEFCAKLAKPLIDRVIQDPDVLVIDAEENAEEFESAIQPYLPGMTLMAIPLMPDDGELIGLVIFYRKGEQPFTEMDMALAEVTAYPTALAVRRNG
jgi:FixJ family two-component response regulator